MKDNNKFTEDDFRKKVDGFSLEEKNNKRQGFKIIDNPIYPNNSLELEDIKKNKK